MSTGSNVNLRQSATQGARGWPRTLHLNSGVRPPLFAMPPPGCHPAAPAWPSNQPRQRGGARRGAKVRRAAGQHPRRRRCQRFRAIRRQQVARSNGPHALMRVRRGDHGARAARNAQRRHRRSMSQVGPHIRQAARDVHARQFGQGPYGRRCMAQRWEMWRRPERRQTSGLPPAKVPDCASKSGCFGWPAG